MIRSFGISSSEKSGTSNNHNGGKNGLLNGWKGLAGDSLALARLQAKLFRIDGKTWLGQVQAAFALVIASIVVGIASMPLLLMAAAVGLNTLGLHIGWALLIVGGSALVVAAIVGAVFVNKIFQSAAAFDQSREEFAKSLDWIQQQFTDPPEA